MHTTLLALFAATALAAPAPVEDIKPLPPQIQRCMAAENCETWQNGNRTSIRFVSGMEPGSEDYTRRMRLARRDDEDHKTYVTLGDTKVEYGCGDNQGDVDPVAQLGNLDKPCKDSGACVDSEPYTEDIHYVLPNPDGMAAKGSTQTLQIKGEGQYTPDMKGPLIQAIQALAGQGQIRAMQDYSSISKRETPGIANPDPDDSGTCELVQQTGFYDVERYSADGKSLAGFMKATISLPELDGGFCDHIGPMIEAGAIAGAIPAVGGAIAGVFGTVVAACNM